MSQYSDILLRLIADNTAGSGTTGLTDTELRATPVPISGSVTADLGANNDVTVTSGAITETNSTAILADTAAIDTNVATVAGDTTEIAATMKNAVDRVDAAAFTATITSADATSATSVKAKTADKRMFILSILVTTDTAMGIQFQDDNTPTVLMEQMYVGDNGGFGMTFHKEAPMIVGTNFDLDVITTAAGNISVHVTGYLAT
jgi:hypothetical protein